MGIIGAIIHNIKNMRRASKLRAMSEADWDALDDEAFYDALCCVCNDAVYDICDKDLNGIQKVIYVLTQFESEVNNGGLCQFFANSSRECAPYMSDALSKVGATEIQNLFDQFVSQNKIDVNDLSAFVSSNINEYEEKASRYDFDWFDDKFYEDEKLHGQIIAYARAHIKDVTID